EDWIVAAHQGVSVGSRYFPDVRLGAFVDALREALVARCGKGGLAADYYAAAPAALLADTAASDAEPPPASRAEFLRSLTDTEAPAVALDYDGFFERIGAFLCDAERGHGVDATTPYVVVSDAGFAL